jgi:ankyrin repeat protein
MTPLSLAAYKGRKELAEMLVDRGANIEHADTSGMSPIVQTDFTSHDNRSM